MRIAALDDDPVMHHFYQKALTCLGHQVLTPRTGQQLVELCRRSPPDLVVAGLRLTNREDIATVEAICRDRPTPVLLVLGENDAGLLRGALDNPCVLACLFKPVPESELGAAVALAVRRFEELESLRQEAAELRQALEDRKVIERAKGLVMRYVHLDEEEAYLRLRKLASDQNRKLAEVAQTVLSAAEVFRHLEADTQYESCKVGHAPRGHDGRG